MRHVYIMMMIDHRACRNKMSTRFRAGDVIAFPWQQQTRSHECRRLIGPRGEANRKHVTPYDVTAPSLSAPDRDVQIGSRNSYSIRFDLISISRISRTQVYLLHVCTVVPLPAGFCSDRRLSVCLSVCFSI